MVHVVAENDKHTQQCTYSECDCITIYGSSNVRTKHQLLTSKHDSLLRSVSCV